MILTLKPETERAIEEAARQRGTTPDAVVEETMARELLPAPAQPGDAEERARRKQEAYARIKSGYYARLLGPSSYMGDKAEERTREERRWR